jgi:hypothetical protein
LGMNGYVYYRTKKVLYIPLLVNILIREIRISISVC